MMFFRLFCCVTGKVTDSSPAQRAYRGRPVQNLDGAQEQSYSAASGAHEDRGSELGFGHCEAFCDGFFKTRFFIHE